VGSVKNTTEEVTVVNSERKWNEGRGSWRKGNGRGLECPLTTIAIALALRAFPYLEIDRKFATGRIPTAIHISEDEYFKL